MRGEVDHSEAHVEEQDRSLTAVEVSLPTAHPLYQRVNQVIHIYKIAYLL